MLGAAFESETLDGFIEVERGCCSFLDIDREQVGETTRVVFSSDDAEREPALDVIARMFDPARPSTSGQRSRDGDGRRTGALVGALGVACLACCLPVLLAAGAAGSLMATFGGTAGVAGALTVFFTVVALFTFARRRTRNRTSSCGC